uniref:MADF domain-containing protein n=2 Tax=Bursaphelenchus xylophilus TaxID=6326 RepID=A0A1I7SLT6_BURXY
MVDPTSEASSTLPSASSNQSPTSIKSGMNDKIPSNHSDLIIAMILARSDELFADNRKRKPIYNARRKAKWKELVENLNQQLGMDYSVERVKNNYHYRVTSLKRNMNRQMTTLKEDVSLNESPAYQQLSEIDRMLYEAVKAANQDEFQPPIKRKKSQEKSEDPEEKTEGSFDHSFIDRLFENGKEERSLSPESNDDTNLKKIMGQMIKNQAESFQALRNFMTEQTLQQAKIIEMMAATVELVRESTSHLERASNLCPTCTGNLLEKVFQPYGQKDGKEPNELRIEE